MDRTEKAFQALLAQEIETPSWAYGPSGTRFQVFHIPGEARNVWEKLEDAALVHRLTGLAPRVALHIPWDWVEDWHGLRVFAEERGIGIGAINPNLFQDGDYRLGSLAHPEARVRSKALAHIRECLEVMRATGSRVLSLWLADGINYPGQDSFRARKQRLLEGLQELCASLPQDVRLLLEYKFFEPAFYATDIPDWGTAYALVQRLGAKAQVLVDLGHHPQGTNIEALVAFLLDEGALGGFHFNGRKYADDDLIVGSINPYELFLIYHELVTADEEGGVAGETARRLVFMLDQVHAIEPKVEAVILSLLNCQEAYAKALLVDREALREAQEKGDVLLAHRILLEAYRADVRRLLAEVRQAKGVPVDPLRAYREGGYYEEAVRRRG
ncbi:L-rhamnose isomerase [Thermus oshimai]|uniref:L-rhamnose isomerase n=1 Tax=Thermus caliditerrae TaxID=1330700 RepID=A0A7C5VFS6_9DEIN